MIEFSLLHSLHFATDCDSLSHGSVSRQHKLACQQVLSHQDTFELYRVIVFAFFFIINPLTFFIFFPIFFFIFLIFDFIILLISFLSLIFLLCVQLIQYVLYLPLELLVRVRHQILKHLIHTQL